MRECEENKVIRNILLLNNPRKTLLLVGLGAIVALSVLERPTALLTFGFIPLAGIFPLGQTSDQETNGGKDA